MDILVWKSVKKSERKGKEDLQELEDLGNVEPW